MPTLTQKQERYRRYIKTNRWRELRKAVLERDGHQCVRCGSDRNLQVHHLTYERVFGEDLDDLVTWCEVCHLQHHEAIWAKREKKNRRTNGGRKVGVCRSCGVKMEKPYWGPGGGFYCSRACKPEKRKTPPIWTPAVQARRVGSWGGRTRVIPEKRLQEEAALAVCRECGCASGRHLRVCSNKQ